VLLSIDMNRCIRSDNAKSPFKIVFSLGTINGGCWEQTQSLIQLVFCQPTAPFYKADPSSQE
jgi:hypothetical protein